MTSLKTAQEKARRMRDMAIGAMVTGRNVDPNETLDTTFPAPTEQDARCLCLIHLIAEGLITKI